MCYEVCETVFQIRDLPQESLLSTNTEDAYLRLSGLTKYRRAAKNSQVSVAPPQASCLILFFLYFS